jgi:preprotein translocase subunit SecA
VESTQPLLLTLAQALLPDDFPSPGVEESEPLSSLVWERHFLRAHDDKIVAFARSLGRRCRARFHLSRKDPLMRVFAGEWVEGVLRTWAWKNQSPFRVA